MAEHDTDAVVKQHADAPPEHVEEEEKRSSRRWTFWISVLAFLLLAVALVLFIVPAQFRSWKFLLALLLGLVQPILEIKKEDIPKGEFLRHPGEWRGKNPKFVKSLATLPLFIALGFFATFADLSSIFDSASTTSQAGFEKSLENSAANTNKRLAQLGSTIQQLHTGSSSGGANESDPRAQIVELTGSWSEKGFHDAIEEPGDDEIVKLYLRSGMQPTTAINGASAILYGFQDGLGNDPVDLLKIFQANGFTLNEDLTDGLILQSLNPGGLLPFQGPLAPKNYTGGFWVSDAEPTGVFSGPLMLWIVEKDMMTTGPTDQDTAVLKYLISQGADCTVSLAFLDYNRTSLADTSNFTDLYPTIKACAH
jgi:hypothetical protein